MPRFEPFAGLLYPAGDGNLDAVIAPPYDVVDQAERAELAARNPFNSIRLELPEDMPERGLDRYQAAAALWREWQEEGALAQDPEPSFYLYRMDFQDELGRARQTTGVVGALELQDPGAGDILPHERTTPKAKSDRLDLLRATRANLSPVWGLSMRAGLSDLLAVDGPPDLSATDDDRVHHHLWRISSPRATSKIADAVGSSPVVIADGHHRYATGLNYRAELRGAALADGGQPPAGADLIMALVVELSEEQLSVQAIHRLLAGLPAGTRLPEAFERWFEIVATGPVDGTLPARMMEAGALALVTSAGTWLLRPGAALAEAAEHDLDSARLDVALAALAPAAVTFQHGVANVARAVAAGEAEAGVLLRPATVEVIAATARARRLMPPKTTFFAPKPRTGLVFRSID